MKAPSFHGIIGRSAPMAALFRRIERVAQIDIPVLIQRETGTGKELVARAIWERSARRHRRFEGINAGALNRELLLSELFGHERGAFTGAIARKPGLLTVVDSGTIFLDEVGDVPLDAQVMLFVPVSRDGGSAGTGAESGAAMFREGAFRQRGVCRAYALSGRCAEQISLDGARREVARREVSARRERLVPGR